MFPASEALGYQRASHALDASVLLKFIAVTGHLVLAMAISVLSAPAVFAHGGGLDSQGCHTNRKTGGRHCHRSGRSSPTSKSGLVSGPVTLLSVGDGDTVRVSSRQGMKVTIRLACIDAPETSQGASGKWSTQTLKGLVQGKSISLNPQVKDRYGRTVAEIYVGNRNINLQMVRQGAAYAYRKYLKPCDRDAYIRAQSIAIKEKLGVWGPYRPNKFPWDFRRSRRR